MALSSSLSLPLHLLQYATTSSGRLGLHALYRPSSRSIVRLQPTRGLKPIVAASYLDEAAGHGDNGGIAATSVLLRQVDDAAVAELRAARIGRTPPPPKGRPGRPNEGGGGKIHAAPTSSAKRVLRRPTPPGLPAEGPGGPGGSKP